MSDDEFLNECLRAHGSLTTYGYERLRDTIVRIRDENATLTLALADAEARAEKMREGIEDFHRAECGCLDWKRDTQCMTLRALTAPTPPQQEK